MRGGPRAQNGTGAIQNLLQIADAVNGVMPWEPKVSPKK
jgi:hypothetical protein